MKKTAKQAFVSYGLLFNFKDYKYSEIIIKGLLMPVVFTVFTALFIITWGLYLVERLLSPLFKLFLVFHMKMMQRRAHGGLWQRRLLGLVTFLVTLVFLPIVIVYYASMLLKALMKHLMRTLIIKMDFSVQFSYGTIKVFDDQERATEATMAEMFKDAGQTEALGKMLETYFNEAPDFEETHENNQKPRKD